MRKMYLLLLAATLAASLGMAPATSPDSTPQGAKTGVCVHVPRLSDAPYCVLVDPSE